MDEHDDNCLFCKIAKKTEKAYIIWENETHMAFLSIFPNSEGVTVVIPKSHHSSYAFDLDANNLTALTLASQEVARYLDENLPNTMRTAMVYEGFGVNHVHAKLFPMHGPKLNEWKPIKSNIRTKFKNYEGYISSHDSERAAEHELISLQHILTRKFIETIQLKQLCLQDVKQFFNMLSENRVFFGDGFKSIDSCKSEHQAKKFIKDSLDEYNSKKSATFGVWQDKKLIGIIALQSFNWQDRTAEVGYYLNESFTGRGVMTAACKNLLKYGFLNLKLNIIFINVNEDNKKGIAIPERLMFGSPRVYEQNVNEIINKFVEFSMRSSDWLNLQNEDSYNMIPDINIESPPLPTDNSYKSCFTSAYRTFNSKRLSFAALLEATKVNYGTWRWKSYNLSGV